jgi:aminobenzoyl-glutamate utilization protein B
MMNAAKTLTLTGMDLFNNPDMCEKAKKELTEKTGADFQYNSLIGDRKPPLDFRKGLN